MLTISRSDVPSEFIEQRDIDERFIKLPVEKYLAMEEVEPLRPQIAVINALNNPKYRFVVGALSRRTGKTYIANVIAHLMSLIPDHNVLIMSPNYNLSEISFKQQRDLLRKYDVEVRKDNAKDRVIELINGSTIRMGSVNQVDACVGRSYNMILFDEAALHPEGDLAFQVALRPTLDRPGSKAVFISTPRGRNNWFSHYYNRGFGEDFPEWCSVHSDYRENNRMGEADVMEARRSMSNAEFKQEYEASFVSFQGQIYHFDADVNVFDDDYELPNDLEVFAGLDPGFRDPTAYIVIGFSPSTECYYILDEYQQAEANTARHAERIKELNSYLADCGYDVEMIYIDSAAAQTQYDLAYEHDLTCTPANKSILDGISFCQSIVEQGKLFVASKCGNTLAMLDQYSWAETIGNAVKEKPKHDIYSHMADAMRYSMYTWTKGTGDV